jgi:hypothetical protein
MRRLAALLIALATAAAAAGPAGGAQEDPFWRVTPTADQVVAILDSFPACLIDGAYTPGSALVACETAEDGGLRACQVLAEEPKGCHYGAAALEVAKIFRARDLMLDGRPVRPGTQIRLPMDFRGLRSEPNTQPVRLSRPALSRQWSSAPITPVAISN